MAQRERGASVVNAMGCTVRGRGSGDGDSGRCVGIAEAAAGEALRYELYAALAPILAADDSLQPVQARRWAAPPKVNMRVSHGASDGARMPAPSRVYPPSGVAQL